MIFNLTISRNTSNSRVVPKLFYFASYQNVHQFVMFNIADKSHYACILSLTPSGDDSPLNKSSFKI